MYPMLPNIANVPDAAKGSIDYLLKITLCCFSCNNTFDSNRDGFANVFYAIKGSIDDLFK